MEGKSKEEQMREAKIPTHKTIEELCAYINELVEQEHDYGTCVYAMSHAAVAAFKYVASRLQVTGFQASCADLDILRHTRGLERGCVINFHNLLYPQYKDEFPPYESYVHENREWLREEAKKLLAKNGDAHPEVRAHWEYLAGLQ